MSKIFTKVIVHTVNNLTNHYWLSEIVIWQVPKTVTLSDTECMSSLDIYVSLKPEAIKIFKRSWYFAVKAIRTIPQADDQGLHTVNGKVGGIVERLFLHATWPGWNPGGAAPKGRWLSRIHREFWWLRVWGWHICLSWTLSITQSKGHSGLANFYDTGFGTCGWEKYTQAIMISSVK